MTIKMKNYYNAYETHDNVSRVKIIIMKNTNDNDNEKKLKK